MTLNIKAYFKAKWLVGEVLNMYVFNSIKSARMCLVLMRLDVMGQGSPFLRGEGKREVGEEGEGWNWEERMEEASVQM